MISGSGFKFLKAYDSGFLSVVIKLWEGYIVGVIKTLYIRRISM